MDVKTAQPQDDRTRISSLIEPKIRHGQISPKVLAKTRNLKIFNSGKSDTLKISVNQATSFSQTQNLLKKGDEVVNKTPKALSSKPKSSNTAITMWSFYAFLTGLVFLVIYYSVFIYDRDGPISPSVQSKTNVNTKKIVPKSQEPLTGDKSESAPSPSEVPASKTLLDKTKPTETYKAKGVDDELVDVSKIFEVEKGVGGQNLYISRDFGIKFSVPSGWIKCDAFFALSDAPSLALYNGPKCPIADEKTLKMMISFSKDSVTKILENPLASFTKMDTWTSNMSNPPEGMQAMFISDNKDNTTGFRTYYKEIKTGNVMFSVPVKKVSNDDPGATEPMFAMDDDVEKVVMTLKPL